MDRSKDIREIYKPIWTREFGWINPVGGGDGEEDAAEAARKAAEQSAMPTSELEPPVVEAAAKPTETLLAGKYKTPEELESAYNELLGKKNTVENENSQYREYYAREQSEARAQEVESTSNSDEQKTARQTADALIAQGKYLDATEVLAEAKAKAQLKPIVDRQEAQDKAHRRQMAEQAFDSLKTDKENFPGFAELEKKMDTLFQERDLAHPGYEKSFKSPKAMMASLYFEVRGNAPQANSKARELAGVMSGSSGTSARMPGITQVAQKVEKPRWQTDQRWEKLGMKSNPYQFDESAEDISNRELSEKGNRIDELLDRLESQGA